MAEFIEILSPSALKDLTTANDEVVKLISNINSAGKAMQSIKTPSGSDSAVKNLSNNLIAQEKNIQKVQQALEKARIEEIKLQQAREKAFDKYDAQLAKEQAKLNASQQLYSKVQAKLNALSNEYRNLAVKKELSGKLTDAEAKRYDYLSSRITKYDTTLKAVDASMGKYQRNVGNYASAFNPLSNSINQLTREMPAFANSVQTGFMAISNNLPIFFDAIQSANAEIKALRANGEATPTLFQKLTSSILSWGTALSVGVTLLTVFGDEIVDAIFNTKAKAKADEDAKKVIESKNKAEQDYIDTIRNSASEEISRSKTLFENARNVNIAMKDRLSYIKELKERYPDYLGNLRDQDILAGNTAEAEERLNDALIKRGIALAIQDKIKEKYKALTDEIIKLEEAQKRSSKSEEIANTISQKTGTNKEVELKRAQLLNRLEIANSKENIKTKNDEIKSLFNLFNSYAPYLTSVRESTEATKENIEAKEEKEKIDQDSLQALEETISALQKEQKQVSFGSETYEALGFQLKLLQTIYDGLTKKAEETTEAIKGIELNDEQVYEEYFAWLKLKEATDEYIKTITSDAFNNAFNNIGLASAKMFLDFDENGQSTFDKLIEGADTMSERFAVSFQAIGDVAQDVIGMMQNLENQRSEQQLANLEREYQTALLFAGESTTAREELERQYDERRKAIQRRQAQQQKQLAIFNILINTAQGVVSALAMTPPNVPLSIAIGAIGALQAGIVASQQLPQFYKGTDNAPEGWAWTQEKGAEIITDKSGKIKTLGSDKGAQKTYLNKGDKVYTASQTESILFNNELNGILTNNGISNAPTVIVDGGLSKEDFNNGISKLAKTISEKESFSISRDKRGERVFREKQNKRTELLNVRLKMGKYDV
jgi:hypothetical protein